MKKLASLLLATVMLGMAAGANAVTINFDSAECGTCSSGTPVVGDEWAAFGITVNQAYWYFDGRDTFDQEGLSVNIDPASIVFDNVSTNATIDYWVINGFTGLYQAYDAMNNLIDSILIDASNGDVLGTYTFVGQVASIVWSGTPGFAQISTLTISDVPEPGVLALFLIGGLAGLLGRRRRV
ncbi:MAG: PEP-CTERM sorting domain-containing protein [Woeseiaceae bacterium]|nr:PEP-CTERM sorting domain-containing protein [Woeseiaceae bacterium]